MAKQGKAHAFCTNLAMSTLAMLTTECYTPRNSCLMFALLTINYAKCSMSKPLGSKKPLNKDFFSLTFS